MQAIGRWLSQNLLALGAPGLFLLSLIDSALLPLPQGVDLLLFAQTTRDPAGAPRYAALATAGSVLGCLFLYWLARRGGQAMLARRTSPERIAGLRQKMERYDALTLVLPTLIPLPLPMKLFVIAAGVFQVRLERFLAAVLFARLTRYFGIALLAQRYGDQTWSWLRENAVLTGLGVAGLLAVFYWLGRRRTAR